MKQRIIALLAGTYLLHILLAVSSTAAADSTEQRDSITASAAASLYQPTTTYSIFRKGKNIGTHTLRLEKNENALTVDIESNITVRVLKIPVFKFKYQSTEKWQDDQLVSVASKTTTNNKTETASLTNKENESLLESNTEKKTAPLLSFATNHWHIGALSQSQLFNTITGKSSNVSIEAVGEDSLTINGVAINTTHYRYTGDIITDSWYDDNNRWVKLEFLGSDDSTITYIINNP